MFKRHTGITPLPMNNLFTVNNAPHDYYTSQINSLHTQIGNHMSRKILIDVL